MSKKNLLLGTAAGKVGDLVFYRAGGEQRTRAKVTPNNPKTYAQQAQRSRMANVTLAYRALSALCKDTFTNRPQKQSGFNAFSAAGLPISPYLIKENADRGEWIISPYQIAKGSIPVPFVDVFLNDDGGCVSMDFAAAQNPTTIAQLSAALIAWRPCCFAEGGNLILVSLYSENDNNPGRMSVRYYKIPINTSDTRTLDSLGISVTTQQQQGDVRAMTTLSVMNAYTNRAFAAVIKKPKQGGGYDVCDANLILDDATSAVYDSFITDNAAKDAAISYGGMQGSCVINA